MTEKKKTENRNVHMSSSFNTNILKSIKVGHKCKDGVACFGLYFS